MGNDLIRYQLWKWKSIKRLWSILLLIKKRRRIFKKSWELKINQRWGKRVHWKIGKISLPKVQSLILYMLLFIIFIQYPKNARGWPRSRGAWHLRQFLTRRWGALLYLDFVWFWNILREAVISRRGSKNSKKNFRSLINIGIRLTFKKYLDILKTAFQES